MIIPFGTDRPLHRPTVVTYCLIGICIVMYGVMVFAGRADQEAADRLLASLWLDPGKFRIWGLFTYQFLHAGFWHIAGNMVFLLVFGPNVEDKMGRLWFLCFYLAGGAVAGGAHCFFASPAAEAGPMAIMPPVVGASGSIAAVTGAYMVLFPLTQIKVISFFIIVGPFNIPAIYLISFAILKDMLLQGSGRESGVAFEAHLGGYGFGIAVCLVLLWSRLLGREPYDLFSMGRQAYRRRQFRELATRTETGAPWRGNTAGLKAAAPRRGTAEADREEQIALRRTEISRLHAAGDLDASGALYIALIEEQGEAVMHRQAQLDLANHFFLQGRHQVAASAYEAFLKRHASDGQAAHVKLMLALINARYLNDPVRAKGLLAQLREGDLGQKEQELAHTLMKELG